MLADVTYMGERITVNEWSDAARQAAAETRALHASMSEGAGPHGGIEALRAKVDAHLAGMSKEEAMAAWHEGLGGVQKLGSRDKYLTAIRQRIIGRAGAFDRVNA
jgi:hypothetical protein